MSVTILDTMVLHVCPCNNHVCWPARSSDTSQTASHLGDCRSIPASRVRCWKRLLSQRGWGRRTILPGASMTCVSQLLVVDNLNLSFVHHIANRNLISGSPNSRKGICRNPTEFFLPNYHVTSAGEFLEDFLGPWSLERTGGKNPQQKNLQQNSNQNLGVSRPKSTLQGSVLDNFPPDRLKRGSGRALDLQVEFTMAPTSLLGTSSRCFLAKQGRGTPQDRTLTTLGAERQTLKSNRAARLLTSGYRKTRSWQSHCFAGFGSLLLRRQGISWPDSSLDHF